MWLSVDYLYRDQHSLILLPRPPAFLSFACPFALSESQSISTVLATLLMSVSDDLIIPAQQVWHTNHCIVCVLLCNESRITLKGFFFFF